MMESPTGIPAVVRLAWVPGPRDLPSVVSYQDLYLRRFLPGPFENMPWTSYGDLVAYTVRAYIQTLPSSNGDAYSSRLVHAWFKPFDDLYDFAPIMFLRSRRQVHLQVHARPSVPRAAPVGRGPWHILEMHSHRQRGWSLQQVAANIGPCEAAIRSQKSNDLVHHK